MTYQHATQTPIDATAPAAPSPGRMECGVCWYVYDPAKGDDVWQVAPGTEFRDLPDHWRCPECDQEKHTFLPMDDINADHGIANDVGALIDAYRCVDQERMQDLPFRNSALSVEAVGFQPWDGGQLGVVITPWFMNLILLQGVDMDWSGHKHGDLVARTLPSGVYEFIHGDLERFGVIQSCSLMSPVPEFEDMASARATAEEVMRLMLSPPDQQVEEQGMALKTKPDPEPTIATGEISRRELLRGRRDNTPPQA